VLFLKIVLFIRIPYPIELIRYLIADPMNALQLTKVELFITIILLPPEMKIAPP